MSDNVAVVREFFTFLERGDLSGVVGLVEEEVDWQSPVTRSHPPEIPWSSIRRTKQEVATFFRELGQNVKPEGFELFKISAQDDRVVVEGKNKGTVRKTGRTYEHEWVMIFSIRDNKIVRFRHYYDTADLLGAFRVD
jgi:ketosteroid isomerase-like protein